MTGQLVLQKRLPIDPIVQLLPEGLYVAELDENGRVIRAKIKTER